MHHCCINWKHAVGEFQQDLCTKQGGAERPVPAMHPCTGTPVSAGTSPLF